MLLLLVMLRLLSIAARDGSNGGRAGRLLPWREVREEQAGRGRFRGTNAQGIDGAVPEGRSSSPILQDDLVGGGCHGLEVGLTKSSVPGIGWESIQKHYLKEHRKILHQTSDMIKELRGEILADGTIAVTKVAGQLTRSTGKMT